MNPSERLDVERGMRQVVVAQGVRERDQHRGLAGAGRPTDYNCERARLLLHRRGAAALV
jgi:hypothetical protein